MAVLWNNDGLAFSPGTVPGAFPLLGGRYCLALSAMWAGGSITLQVLMPDASTYVTVHPAFTADGAATLDLGPGTYRLLVTGAGSPQGFLVRVPYRAA